MESKGRGTPRKLKSKFYFKPPPEAPVFTPTPDEFKDPLAYIKQIKEVGERVGICKIIPPVGWKPPFVLDKDKLIFTPRIQRINELEARTRIKLNFIDKLTKFFAQSGKTFQIPVVEKESVDLHTLCRLVKDKGGLEEVNREKKWSEIAIKMGYTCKTSPLALKTHYENLLQPFVANIEVKKEAEEENIIEAILEKKTPGKLSSYRELRSLRFLGPGPKMSDKVKATRTRGKKIMYEFDPYERYLCKSCNNGDVEDALTSCVKCSDRYHSSCLIPPLNSTPVDWRCPKCVAAEHYKPLEDFGFAQAETEYTLTDFKKMADKFKTDYFKTTEPITTHKVEEEFWRVVSSIDTAVSVQYGADLHVIDHGSGFPRKGEKPPPNIIEDEFEYYAESPWNLNNLPVLKGSVLRHISADISGMKIPWMYAGMCFAAFCWHNEDHWSYSINYLHMGDPKTWYGVSGHDAEMFEKAMKNEAPELFEAQPDLLHQLVTIMNPNDLTNAGVNVYRTDQKEGEFVITFPRAYHAGFNQGFNFAEACNFAPHDWLEMGRECIYHYATVKRPCVFSHDELVTNMANSYGDLDEEIAIATMNDITTMIDTEDARWTNALLFGVTKVALFSFANLPDDERQCIECNTTVYLSAITCPCNPSKLVCLDHIDKLCKCKPENYVIKCQIKIGSLVEKLDIMKNKLCKFINWQTRVNIALSPTKNKTSLRYLTELLIEAREKEFPPCDLLTILEACVKRSIDCSALARALFNNMAQNNEENMINIDDLTMFCTEIEQLPCIISEYQMVKDLKNRATKFQNAAKKLLYSKKTQIMAQYQTCLKIGKDLNLDLVEIPLLENKLKSLEWEESCKNDVNENVTIKAKDEKVQIKTVKKRLKKSKPRVEIVKEEKQEEKIDIKVVSPKQIPKLEVKNEPLSAEQLDILCEIEELLKGKNILYLSELEEKLAKAKLLGLEHEPIKVFENCVNALKDWKTEARGLFYRAGSNHTLLQMIWPRKFLPRLNFEKCHANQENLIQINSNNFYRSDFDYCMGLHLESLFKLRLDNLKQRLNSDVICCCNEVIQNKKIECFLCLTLYHPECFKMGSRNKEVFFDRPICNFCTRSNRPGYKSVLELYNKQKEFKIRIPECFAVTCLVGFYREKLVELMEILRNGDLAHSITIINRTMRCYNLRRKKRSLDKVLDELSSQVKIPNTISLLIKQCLMVMDSCELSSKWCEEAWTVYLASRPSMSTLRAPMTEPSSPLSSSSSSTKVLGKRSRKSSDKKITRRKISELIITDELPHPGVSWEEHEEGDTCAKIDCNRPSVEDVVSWIQCEGYCKKWFHMKCLNLDEKLVDKSKEFICDECTSSEKDDDIIFVSGSSTE